MALDPHTVLSLASPRWRRVAELAATTLESARPRFSRTVVAGLPAVTDGTEIIIVTHPLWRTERSGQGAELEAASDEAAARGLAIDPEHGFVSVFEALRRPA